MLADELRGTELYRAFRPSPYSCSYIPPHPSHKIPMVKMEAEKSASISAGSTAAQTEWRIVCGQKPWGSELGDGNTGSVNAEVNIIVPGMINLVAGPSIGRGQKGPKIG